MESKFSSEIKEVISNSRLECLAMGIISISPEMFILGMIRNRDKKMTKSENGALKSIQAANIDINRLSTVLEQKIIKELPKAKEVLLGNIPLTKMAEKAIKMSHQTSLSYKTNGNIETIHLLIAILKGLDVDEAETLNSLTGLSLEKIILHIFSDSPIVPHNENETIEQQLKKSKENILRLKDLSMKLRRNLSPTPPISLYFNTDEYSKDEIKNIISLLSDIYQTHSGDHLVIKGMSQFEVIEHLACI